MAQASTRRKLLATALVDLASVRPDSAGGPGRGPGVPQVFDPRAWRAQRLARAGVEVLEAAAVVVLFRNDAGALHAAASYAAAPVAGSGDPTSDQATSSDLASGELNSGDDHACDHLTSDDDPSLAVASRLATLELADGQGPGIQALRSGELVVAGLSTDPVLWPAWTAAAIAGGWLGVVAVPLQVTGPAVGAMELLRRGPDPPTDADLVWARALAGVTAAALAHERVLHQEQVLADQLKGALDSRVVIEQAKGILAERGRVDVEVAFELLRRYARANRMRLVDVAHGVVGGRLAAAVLKADRPDPPQPPRGGRIG
ncbi:MAG TPA: GAF and ANTAR domain-containing protein [Kineosporiaceae bacterium]|nr:GAF and ANTAR domain-containing protein [Kineosporiaceae bacterium]